MTRHLGATPNYLAAIMATSPAFFDLHFSRALAAAHIFISRSNFYLFLRYVLNNQPHSSPIQAADSGGLFQELFNRLSSVILREQSGCRMIEKSSVSKTGGKPHGLYERLLNLLFSRLVWLYIGAENCK